MPRSITPGYLADLNNTNVPLCVFVELDLAPGQMLRFTNATQTMRWNGLDWLGAGRFTNMQPIEETATPTSSNINLVFSGLDPSFVSGIMNEHYQGRPARIWLATLDDNMGITADPVLIFQGRMDEPVIRLGETADINITLENRWADWSRPRIRRYNGADQNSVYPGDLGLQYAEQMELVQINWGTFKGPPVPKAPGVPLPKFVRSIARGIKRLFGF